MSTFSIENSGIRPKASLTAVNGATRPTQTEVSRFCSTTLVNLILGENLDGLLHYDFATVQDEDSEDLHVHHHDDARRHLPPSSYLPPSSHAVENDGGYSQAIEHHRRTAWLTRSIICTGWGPWERGSALPMEGRRATVKSSSAITGLHTLPLQTLG